jgi:hypothetical protein
VLSHQFVYSAPDGANRNLKALSQIFFVWQGRTWCRRTALDVVDQLPFDLAIKHAESLSKVQLRKALERLASTN